MAPIGDPVDGEQADLHRRANVAEYVLEGAAHCRLTIDGEDHSVAQLAETGAQITEEAAHDRYPAAVATSMENDVRSCSVLLGAIAAGIRFISLPAQGSRSTAEYIDVLADALGPCGDTALVGLAPEVLRGIEARRSAATASPVSSARAAIPDATAFEIVQFTSGTTGPPRGLRISGEALAAAAKATRERLGVDVVRTCSWLPLSHDMGLIGMVLLPLAFASPRVDGRSAIDLQTPVRFLRKPDEWLQRVGEIQCTVTAVPDSALRHLLRARRSSAVADLGGLQSIIVGGEMVRPSTMDAMGALLTACSSGPSVLRPAYGMAEACLAVSITAPGDGYTVVRASQPGNIGPARDWVASGRPLTGLKVERSPGDHHLRISSPEMLGSWIDGTPMVGPDGYYDTPDIGLVGADGEVVVMGRSDDTLVINGHNLPAAIVDHAMEGAPSLRAQRAYACMLADGSWAVVTELRPKRGDGDAPSALQELRRLAASAAGSAPDTVLAVTPSSIPFTTSGKLRRVELGRLVSAGRLPVVAGIGAVPEPTDEATS